MKKNHKMYKKQTIENKILVISKKRQENCTCFVCCQMTVKELKGNERIIKRK